jgi:YjbE family integral membrane protein
MDLSSVAFWTALGSIVLTNIVLSGDNAVVIALAARSLPPAQQKVAVLWGSAAAIVLRVVLTLAAVRLLEWPYLKLVGAVLLLYIGTQLLIDEEDEVEHTGEPQRKGTMAAVRTILVADVVMSLDNVLAVAAAAKNNIVLLSIGLALSVPLIVFGSTLLMRVMERVPLIVTAGGALLGYLAGDMLLDDPGVVRWTGELPTSAHWLAEAAGAALVLLAAWGVRAARRPR